MLGYWFHSYAGILRQLKEITKNYLHRCSDKMFGYIDLNEIKTLDYQLILCDLHFNTYY